MKESGIEWIGEIPDDWTTRKLNRACFFQEGPGLRTWQFVDFGIKVICVTNIHDNIIDFSEMCKYISLEEYLSSYTHFTVQKGDVLLSSSGASWGKVAIFDSDETVILNTSTIRLNATTSDYLTSGYLRWLLSSDNTNKQLELLMTGSCQPNFGPSHLAKIHIPLPSIRIQSQIASFLDTKCSLIDSTIEKEREVIKKLKEYRQAVITEAVTKGIRAGVPKKDSGVEWIGEIPKHWIISRFSFETWVRARLGWKGLKADEYVDDGYIFLSTPNLKEEKIDFENVNYINQFRYDESPEIKLTVGDVLLAKDGSTLGTVNVVRNLPKEATVNGSIAVITPKNNVNSVYLMYLIKSSYIQNIIRCLKDGSGVPHLFQRDINKIYITRPPLPEQQEIADYLDAKCSAIDATIQKRELAIEKLTVYKQSLIYECVTGKKEVMG